MKVGDKVSVFVDLNQRCKKGLIKHFENEKFFIGNGTVQLTREQIFAQNGENIRYLFKSLFFETLHFSLKNAVKMF